MYKTGDNVSYGPQGHKAKVIRPLSNGDYLIEFDNKDLIPPQMDVPGNLLYPDLEIESLEWSGSHTRVLNCPRCGGEWTETWIGHKPFYDCLKCNIKKEDVS